MKSGLPRVLKSHVTERIKNGERKHVTSLTSYESSATSMTQIKPKIIPQSKILKNLCD